MTTINRIIPVLVYEDIQSAHDFLVDTFGFTTGNIFQDEDGNVVHGEVYAGDLVIWLHRVSKEYKLVTPRTHTVVTSGLVIHVDDVDAHYRRVREKGAAIEQAPQNMPYGQREYYARDPEGHCWWFATPHNEV